MTHPTYRNLSLQVEMAMGFHLNVMTPCGITYKLLPQRGLTHTTPVSRCYDSLFSNYMHGLHSNARTRLPNCSRQLAVMADNGNKSSGSNKNPIQRSIAVFHYAHHIQDIIIHFVFIKFLLIQKQRNNGL